jgi:hypothetical protein
MPIRLNRGTYHPERSGGSQAVPVEILCAAQPDRYPETWRIWKHWSVRRDDFAPGSDK